MKPLPGMRPMTPMAAMEFAKPWWPTELGEPSTSGAQNGVRYAYFAEPRRLLIEEKGQLTSYDTGDHQISGVSQAQSHDQMLVFTSQHGAVKLEDLAKA